ncbi:MAG: DUF1254 domain-containing protein [Proteobacteria bacterium]|nr:DUF1254 domain-containing protein [Pseudomonadota bacterium]
MSLRTLALALSLAATVSLPAKAQLGQPHPADAALAHATAFQATVFGFPLQGMYQRLTEEVLTPATRKAALNTYFHYTALSTPEISPFPAPNNDTLYSTAWLDLRKEPAILTMPETVGRYYVAHILDMATETIGNVGQRLNGTQAGKFAVVGPGWQGTLPADIKGVIRSDTAFAYVLLRLLVDGPEDVANVNALQMQFAIASLSRHLAGQTGGGDAASIEPFQAGNAAERLKMLDRVIRMSPVLPRDEGVVASFATIGVGPSTPSLRLAPTPEVLEDAEKQARASIASIGARTGHFVNGWRIAPAAIGRYGVDYLQRASVWDGGPLANVIEESFYPAALLDQNNRMLDGSAGRYLLRFPAGVLPPVEAFWSLTMYKLGDKNLVANPIRRYSIGNRTRGLIKGADGALTIPIQADAPSGSAAANWLPAPREPFYMVLRLYGPGKAALEGQWVPPSVEHID